MTGVTHDLYGSRPLSLSEVRSRIQSATGLELSLRNSQHLAGDYFRGGEVGGEEFIVQRNWDEDGETIEEEFAEWRVLFRVGPTDRADQLREKLTPVAGLEFLRRTVT